MDFNYGFLNTLNPSEVFSCEFTFSMENVKIVLVTQDSIATMGNRKTPKSKTPFLHVHPCYELFCCVQGSMQIHFEKEIVNLKPGQMIIIAPKVFHAVKSFEDGTRSPAMLLQISNNGLKVDVDMYDLLRQLLPGEYAVYDLDSQMSTLFDSIAYDAEDREIFNLSLKFHEFFSGLIRLNQSVVPKYVGYTKDNNSIRLHKIFMILTKSRDDISLEQVAEELHLSSRQISRVVKENYDCTFKELVVRFRMEEAANLLVQTKMTVVDVAKNVGYNSVRGFYSAFKNRYGCLPAQYRQQNSVI